MNRMRFFYFYYYCEGPFAIIYEERFFYFYGTTLLGKEDSIYKGTMGAVPLWIIW